MPERIVRDLPFALGLTVLLFAAVELTDAGPAVGLAGFVFISILITIYVSWRGEQSKPH